MEFKGVSPVLLLARTQDMDLCLLVNGCTNFIDQYTYCVWVLEWSKFTFGSGRWRVVGHNRDDDWVKN